MCKHAYVLHSAQFGSVDNTTGEFQTFINYTETLGTGDRGNGNSSVVSTDDGNDGEGSG